MHELGIAHGHNKYEANHIHLKEVLNKGDKVSSTKKELLNENQSQSVN